MNADEVKVLERIFDTKLDPIHKRLDKVDGKLENVGDRLENVENKLEEVAKDIIHLKKTTQETLELVKDVAEQTAANSDLQLLEKRVEILERHAKN